MILQQDALESSRSLILKPTSYNIATQDTLGSSHSLRQEPKVYDIATTRCSRGSSRSLRLELGGGCDTRSSRRLRYHKMLQRVVAI